MTARERINTSGIAAKNRECRHCGKLFQPGNIRNHERVCIMPYTLERVLEMGGLTEYAAARPDECWPWPLPDDSRPYRYGAISKEPVHRITLEMKLGRRLQLGLHALHHCDNPPCINPAHLYEGSQSENIRDIWERSGRPRRAAPESYAKGWETRRQRYGQSGGR